MLNYVELLDNNPGGILAVHDGGWVKTKPYLYLFTINNRVYFCTGRSEALYEQLAANPNISYSTSAGEDGLVISINGRATFVDDLSLKTRALNENPAIRDIYGTPENPELQLFYIEVREYSTFSFKDGPATWEV